MVENLMRDTDPFISNAVDLDERLSRKDACRKTLDQGFQPTNNFCAVRLILYMHESFRQRRSQSQAISAFQSVAFDKFMALQQSKLNMESDEDSAVSKSPTSVAACDELLHGSGEIGKVSNPNPNTSVDDFSASTLSKSLSEMSISNASKGNSASSKQGTFVPVERAPDFVIPKKKRKGDQDKANEQDALLQHYMVTNPEAQRAVARLHRGNRHGRMRQRGSSHRHHPIWKDNVVRPVPLRAGQVNWNPVKLKNKSYYNVMVLLE
jgi:hypothetical protein